MQPAIGGRIVGWGTGLADKVVTNDDLAVSLDTSDEWIVERTGIRERRVGGTTTDLAIAASRAAMDSAGLTAADIDMVALATTTADQVMPQTAASVQDSLGISGGAFDLNAACSGFVYGMVTAYGLLGMGVRRVLLIGAETLSRIVDWDDRDTAVLFADGAGAVIIEASPTSTDLVAWDLGSDGSSRHLITADHGGFLKMEGREVFRRAVRVIVDTTMTTLDRAGLCAEDLDLVIPHQANIRIIEAATERLGIPMSKTVNDVVHTGNTSAASIPIGLVSAIEADRLHEGDLVLLVGFGAGMSWGSVLLRWGART